MVSDETKQEIKRLFVEEGRTAEEIAGQYGFTPSKIRNILRRTEGAKRYSRATLQVGELFGDGNLEIVAIGSPKKEKKSGVDRQTYDVKCKLCGLVSNVLRQNLVKNSRRCCQGCMKAGQDNLLWQGYEDLSLTFFHDIRNGAIARNLSFEITIEQAWQLYQDQDGKCALSGEKISFDINTSFAKGRKPTASLDRINSKLGYTLDNIQWVHEDVNWMKQDFTQEEFIEWCNKVNNHSLGLTSYNNDIELQIRSHHKNWRGYGNLSMMRYTKYAYNAKRRSHVFNLSIEYLWQLFIKQRGLCALSGIPINFHTKSRETTNSTASLDRIDSLKGYIENNVQWIYKDLNFIKHKLTQERFKELCCLISIKNHPCVY
jgi:hypothetical protein